MPEYGIDKHIPMRDEVMNKSGSGRCVPVMEIEGGIIDGFSPGAIKQAVERRRRHVRVTRP